MLPIIKELIKKYYISLTSICIFFIYILTLAPGVVEIDSGELATVQATLGIAHPTGYPLFTMFGFLLLKIPFPASIIYKANLLAAIWCTLGIWVLMKTILFVLENSILENQKDEKIKNKKADKKAVKATNLIPPYLFPCVAIFSGLMLGFSKTFWMQSTSVEVYSLQILLFVLIIYATLKAYFSNKENKSKWMWFGFTLALGFSNHMTTLLILPFSAILFFQKEKLNNITIKKILLSVSVFIPALIIIYSYLPLRAVANPIMNWGNPFNWENFFRHISGKQYQVWMFSSIEATKTHLASYLVNFPAEFGYAGLIIGLIGIIYSYKVARKLFYALLITYFTSVLYVINYDITDLDSYFLMSYMMFSFFIAFGFVRIIFYLQKNLTNVTTVIAITTIFALCPLALNYSDVDQSDVHTFEDYTRAILNSTKKNSIILSYQWDYFVAASYYFQNIEGFRNDATIIDKELLRRSWYYNQLQKNHPGIFAGMENEISNFLEVVKPFERDEQYTPNVIEKCYRAVMTKIISENIDKQNVYIGIELFQNEMQRGEFTLPKGYQLVPDVLLFKVVKGNEYVPAVEPNFTLRFPKEMNIYLDKIGNFVATMLVYRASYELQFNKPDRARIYIAKVKRDFPDYQIPYDIDNRIK
jgi:hypothetical protein